MSGSEDVSSCPFCDCLILKSGDLEPHVYEMHKDEATEAGWNNCHECLLFFKGSECCSSTVLIPSGNLKIKLTQWL